MNVVVQKFGGTSVRNEEMRRAAAHHVEHEVKQGRKVVAVVSAMGRKGDPYATDTLLSLLDNNYHHARRESDLLISCGEIISAVVLTDLLRSSGIKVQAMTGAQAGIRTNDAFGEARIMNMECQGLQKALENTDVVVVAGFQGSTSQGDITTLGRGGSDTTAAALAAALEADRVEIFTDVEGIMTADPRIVEKAAMIQSVTYEEICNLANQGAKVIHPRAVEIAMQAKIPMRIRSTLSENKGTLVAAGVSYNNRLVTSIAHLSGITQITVKSEENLNVSADVFESMTEADISVDFINIQPSSVIYTVPDARKDEAVKLLQDKGYEPHCLPGCAKVSAVGAGMTGVPGVASKIVAALTEENIQIYQSADSHTTIWVLVRGEDMEKAVCALHNVFQLDNAQ
ncbi:aspartate kinase [Bacillus piscicola]|uniref:aspartate kinase n=1 Tax=Bacillus piscicola TaxID=1632684 RepID=UPI001F09D3A9|nr:aspartate kinase [Bacillus piscicola]